MQTTASRVVAETPHYVVCLVMRGSMLTVQSKKTGKGKSITGADVLHWLEAFEKDADLTNELARAFLAH